jgi:hypothetical protein
MCKYKFVIMAGVFLISFLALHGCKTNMNNAVMVQDKSDKPQAPLRVSISTPKTGLVVGENTLVFTVQPLIDSKEVNIKWELPQGIVAMEGGTESNWHIANGEIAEILVKIYIPDEKRYEVNAWAKMVLDPVRGQNGKEITQGATLIIDLGEPEKVVKPFRSDRGPKGEGIIEYQGVETGKNEEEGK